MEKKCLWPRATRRHYLALFALSATAVPALANVDVHKVPCTAAQTTIINAAMKDARTALVTASKSFESNPPVEKQAKWFGGLNSQSTGTVKNVYERALGAATVSIFWCPVNNDLAFKWDAGDLAAVSPLAPGAIFITPDFFKLATTGADSQRGTVIHELTHIVGIGLKPKEVYGVNKAKALAASEPARARNNSDNYQYYIEDLLFGIP